MTLFPKVLFIFFIYVITLSLSDNSLANCQMQSFVVAIDIGHTKNRPGATSARGLSEFYFNKNIAKLLQKELIGYGFRSTFIINEAGKGIALPDRSQMANISKADLLISIHHDSVQEFYLKPWKFGAKTLFYSDQFSGFSIFVSMKNIQSKRSVELASLIGSEFLRNSLKPTLHHGENVRGENREFIDRERGIYRFDDLVVLKTAEMPAVLLECGIIVNRDEEMKLMTKEYKEAIILSIRDAIKSFCDESAE